MTVKDAGSFFFLCFCGWRPTVLFLRGVSVRVWLHKLFHMACIAHLSVSLLILYNDCITFLLDHFVWYWLEIGREFVFAALVKQDLVTLHNVTVF